MNKIADRPPAPIDPSPNSGLANSKRFLRTRSSGHWGCNAWHTESNTIRRHSRRFASYPRLFKDASWQRSKLWAKIPPLRRDKVERTRCLSAARRRLPGYLRDRRRTARRPCRRNRKPPRCLSRLVGRLRARKPSSFPAAERGGVQNLNRMNDFQRFPLMRRAAAQVQRASRVGDHADRRAG